jgi:hypothetical protein
MRVPIILMRELIPPRPEKIEAPTESLLQRAPVSKSTPTGFPHAQEEVSQLGLVKRTGKEIEAEIVALRNSSLEEKRLEFARLFKELRKTYAKKRTGNFWQRVRTLGFKKTTAQRWMAEYDRVVGHKSKTTRDGSFPPELFAAGALTRKGDVKSWSPAPAAHPDEKQPVTIPMILMLTPDERQQFLSAWDFIGPKEAQRLVFKTVIAASRRRPTSESDQVRCFKARA